MAPTEESKLNILHSTLYWSRERENSYALTLFVCLFFNKKKIPIKLRQFREARGKKKLEQFDVIIWKKEENYAQNWGN